MITLPFARLPPFGVAFVSFILVQSFLLLVCASRETPWYVFPLSFPTPSSRFSPYRVPTLRSVFGADDFPNP
ncbi:hypothetical protein DFJ73DRAFT_872797 [Zopfochytrium polystomum]|nr:hypothetical protein DFJ73DRAFT_872797 [Zopfochytrium polystomum]